jgi:hypothetical protein
LSNKNTDEQRKTEINTQSQEAQVEQYIEGYDGIYQYKTFEVKSLTEFNKEHSPLEVINGPPIEGHPGIDIYGLIIGRLNEVREVIVRMSIEIKTPYLIPGPFMMVLGSSGEDAFYGEGHLLFDENGYVEFSGMSRSKYSIGEYDLEYVLKPDGPSNGIEIVKIDNVKFAEHHRKFYKLGEWGLAIRMTTNSASIKSIYVKFEKLVYVKAKKGRIEMIGGKDAIINDLNNIAAEAYQYRIRPSSMGGGGSSYVGYTLPSRLATNNNVIYAVSSVTAIKLTITATSITNSANRITVMLNSDGRLENWTYEGDFK